MRFLARLLLTVIFMFPVFVLTSCNEDAKKLKIKEQQLLLKEKQLDSISISLQEKEMQLKMLEQRTDSLELMIDSIGIQVDSLLGVWNVEMVCTSTGCTGSTVGDVLKMRWEIHFANNQLYCRSFSGNTFNREYIGDYRNRQMHFTFEDPSVSTVIDIVLSKKSNNTWEGVRKITQANCMIQYKVEAVKEKEKK